jgi:hypothetical protein
MKEYSKWEPAHIWGGSATTPVKKDKVDYIHDIKTSTYTKSSTSTVTHADLKEMLEEMRKAIVQDVVQQVCDEILRIEDALLRKINND